MNMGLGVSEILVIVVLVLLLFGTKEVPHLFREMARLFAKLKLYSDRIRRELDDAVRLQEPKTTSESSTQIRKNALRDQYRSVLSGMDPGVLRQKSEAIWNHCFQTPHYKTARAILVYVSIGNEVETRSPIAAMLKDGKRVAIPYCKSSGTEMGIGEIKDFDADTAAGTFGIPEPVERVRDNFFKSDLQLVLCPAVAFDIYGSRLGRGKGFYDVFLKELKGRTPIFGLGFDCQIYQQNLPFDYHDVPMDQVITESGLLLKKED